MDSAILLKVKKLRGLVSYIRYIWPETIPRGSESAFATCHPLPHFHVCHLHCSYISLVDLHHANKDGLKTASIEYGSAAVRLIHRCERLDYIDDGTVEGLAPLLCSVYVNPLAV